MKKRLISMLMAVLMIASLLPASALAGATKAKCDHNGDVTVVNIEKNRAKKTPGVEAVICNDCGAILKSETVREESADGVIITPFTLLGITCRKCKNPVTKEVQPVGCGVAGLTISYCADCGKAFESKDFEKKTYKTEVAKKHAYTDFYVEVQPTCQEDGWGYVLCKNCGHPEFIADADAAVAYVNNSSLGVADRNTLVEKVSGMFSATNEDHKVKSKLIYATAGDTDENGNPLRLKSTGTHKTTVDGKVVELNKQTGKYIAVNSDDVFDYSGDKVCPDPNCNYYERGTETKHTFNISTPGSCDPDESGKYTKCVGDKGTCGKCGWTGGQSISAPPTSWVVKEAKNPTCTSDGNYEKRGRINKDGNPEFYFVDKYGKEIKTNTNGVIEKLDHTWVKYVEKADCVHDGKIYTDIKQCSVCKALSSDKDSAKYDEVKAPGHDWVAIEIVPATCQHDGLEIKQCSVCKDYKLDGNTIEHKSVEKIDKHVASDKLANVKEATCTEVGYTGDKVCKFCGIVLEEGKEIPMVDHTPMDVDAKAPTCTEPGVTKGTVCKVCGTVLSAQETVPALGHKTELVNAKEATCLEAGYTGDKVCTVCKQTIEKGTEVKALGHNYVKGVCTRCDAKQPGYNPFTDVKKGPYYDAILWAYCNGVTNGISDTVFGVDNGCTRAQIVTFLYRAAGQPKVENVKNPFTDVSKNSTYYNAIMWAVENGITTGKTATSFDPNAVCTRGQIVTFLWRYEKAPIVSSLAKFDDVAANSYCYNAVMWAVENGITNGKTTTTFAPNDTCTRAQAVTFIYREFAK